MYKIERNIYIHFLGKTRMGGEITKNTQKMVHGGKRERESYIFLPARPSSHKG